MSLRVCVMEELEKEFETYRRELPKLLEEHQEGKHALIYGDKIEGLFDTFSDAIDAGYEKFGLAQFCVKEVRATEEIHTI